MVTRPEVRTVPRRIVRSGVFVLLGGAVSMPYLFIVFTLAQLFADRSTPIAATLALTVIAGTFALTPPFLDVTRNIEIHAVRSLLDVELPAGTRSSPATRARAAVWFVMHMACGLLAIIVISYVVLGIVAVAMKIIAPDAAPSSALAPGALIGDAPWTPALVLVGVIAAIVLGALVMRALRATAPVLLGPSAAERIATVREQAAELAKRNALARELHDSIGHALTAVTLQAAAARATIDVETRDAALLAVEKTGRHALDELDYVLGVLRAGDSPGAPSHTLADLGELIDRTGLEVQVTVAVTLADIPAPVSREAYRIAQEVLTNVLRHAGKVPVTVEIARGNGKLTVAVRNHLGVPGPRSGGGGRGLDGMRERVELLGGTLHAGHDGETWRVDAVLPLRRPGTRESSGRGKEGTI